MVHHPKTCPTSCPHPQSDALDEIEFVRKPMTDWLSPGELARAGVKAAIAATFGSYADKRELQAVLAGAEVPEDSYECEEGSLWFDYVADIGDGFDPTYSIARLLATDLTLEHEGATHSTRRGAFLLLGGDQVYPTAARDEYQNRFIGPYRAALPYVGVHPPAVYALPGNHDWYDGLTSFLRIFCQHNLHGSGRWIGAWRTRQRRSYFAVRLPGDWWIWAVDSQLASDLDHPQLLYFEELAATIPEADRERQKIILVTAEPNWVYCPHPGEPKTCRRMSEAFSTLAHFEKTYIRAKGLRLRLVLSGDLHHYVRYASEESGATRITSGGGGAYLLGTDGMPEKLEVREGTDETVAADEPRRGYVKQGAYPDAAESRKLASGIWKLPFRNRSFGALFGGIYVLLAWLLQVTIDGRAKTVSQFLRTFIFSPLAVALALIFVFGAYGYSSSKSAGFGRLARYLGIVHGLAHVALCCVVLGIINTQFTTENLLVFVGVVIALMFLTGWLLGGWLFAGYLRIAKTLTGVHAEELFSSMAIQDYKSFLRMRLDEDGTLTVFAIGLRNVAHDWKFVAPGPDGHGAPWFHSRQFGADAEHSPHVIERFAVK